jgi:hypothetical protein
MDKLVGILFLLLFLGGVGFFVYRSYARMGGKGRQDFWGLPHDEAIAHEMWGELNVHVSAGERVATAAVGLAAGALLGGVGVATVQAPRVYFVLTARSRLLVRIVGEERTEQRIYERGQAGVRALGPGSRKVNGLPSTVVRLEPRDGSPPIEALMPDAYLAPLQPWSV